MSLFKFNFLILNDFFQVADVSLDALFDAAEEPEADEPEAPPPVVKKRTTPLKGGTGGNQSQGEKFGLRW